VTLQRTWSTLTTPPAQEVGNLSFIADQRGQAVILFQVASLALTGPSNVVGRALVLTEQTSGQRTCAVIVRTG